MSADPKSQKRLDDVARAAWLYYIAGKTQDEVATELGVSRQSAQRLVSQAMASGMVKVRIDHPISQCLDLASALKDRFALEFCEVVPYVSDPAATSIATAFATGDVLETWLNRTEPLVIGLGTGRTLRAAVEHLPKVDCRQHKIVSLTGNIAPDGSTAYYNVLFTMTEKVTAATYPLPTPVIANTVEEKEMLLGQKTIASTRELARQADVKFVGIGAISENAPLKIDGFVPAETIAALQKQGAVGEILGWTFNADGELLTGLTNDRVCSAPLESGLTIGAASGVSKLPAILAAIKGGLVNGLVTDEVTATEMLRR